MMKVGICGHFNTGSEPIGGQTIKTRIISATLKEMLEKSEVMELDTEIWRDNKILFMLKCIILAYKSDNIIILPAHNGVRLLMPFFVVLSKIFKKKLHYIIVGAWLPNVLNDNKNLIKWCKKIDFIYAQTNTLIKKLEDSGLKSNLYLMTNFKNKVPIKFNEVSDIYSQNIRMCIVSRVNYEKGIETAIKVVDKLNKEVATKTIKLDIYGPIDEKYLDRFNILLNTYKKFVSYKGTIDYNQTTEVIRNYYLLLFPTKYYTEGFPGTILDAYLSGVPVLASRWESWEDIIVEGETGYTFDFDDEKDFYRILKYLIENKKLVKEMKTKCLTESEKYTTDNAIKILLKNIMTWG